MKYSYCAILWGLLFLLAAISIGFTVRYYYLPNVIVYHLGSCEITNSSIIATVNEGYDLYVSYLNDSTVYTERILHNVLYFKAWLLCVLVYKPGQSVKCYYSYSRVTIKVPPQHVSDLPNYVLALQSFCALLALVIFTVYAVKAFRIYYLTNGIFCKAANSKKLIPINADDPELEPPE